MRTKKQNNKHTHKKKQLSRDRESEDRGKSGENI